MSGIRRWVPVLAGSLLAVGPMRAPASAGDAPLQAPPPPDSSELRDQARDAQADFERLRRRWLPENRDWPGGGSCDEVVGRICLRYGEGSDWYPEPEDPRIVERRDALLEVLGRTGDALPGDGWILGQRVFYLVEAGRAGEGVAAAARCGGVEPWWCRALEGYALHRDGRVSEATVAFRDALALMDPERAGAWRDPERLLDDAGRDALDDARDAGRWDAAVRTLWTLSDPLWLVPGNDRWTAHMARRVVAEVRDRARSPWALSWGPDMTELTVRYGWIVGWELQDRGSMFLQDRPGVVGHHDPESRVYVPAGPALRDPSRAGPEAWGTGRDRARAGHTPDYAPVILPGEGQVVVFPRGDRFVVVGAHVLPGDTTHHARHDHPARDSVPPRWRGRPAESGLVLVPVPAGPAGDDGAGPDPLPDGPPGMREARRLGTDRGALLVEVPAGAWVASLESWNPDARRAGRIREGLFVPPVPPDVPTLSGLLLLASAEEGEETLERAAERALPRGWLGVGEPLALGWEVYGLGRRPEGLGYRLTVRDAGGNLLRRAGRWLGLLGDPEEVALAWEEEGPREPGPVFRSVALELGGLEPGRYTVRLELATAGRSTLASERVVEVRDEAPPPPP